MLEGGLMLLGEYPGFERKTRSIGCNRQEVLVFSDDANARFQLLPHDVTENAALLVDVILLCPFDLLGNVNGDHWKRNQLRMRMLQSGSRSLTMILEYQNVLEPAVFL